MQDEIEITRTLKHGNIVKFEGLYEEKQCFYLVMEKCNGGTLFERFISNGDFSEKRVANMARTGFKGNKNLLFDLCGYA